ncbi:MAG: sugar phosphorylase [Anaerolineae bacterium]|nr:sugar phosphorylase [Anaerolineae bacterium]
MTESSLNQRMATKLAVLYGEESGEATYAQLLGILENCRIPARPAHALSQSDTVLICYGDHVQASDRTPLSVLHRFLKTTAPVNTVHILPFYPYSSDDGFSVIDYYAVDPALGGWDDIHALHQDFRLMFDAVLNHISAHSEWFQAFLRGEAPYADFFITVDPAQDLSLVRRPRALPLLTPVETNAGTRYVWTTFSDDQIDLNFSNPEVLLETIRVLLFYVQQGADLIRLDAIAFLWKVIGTACIHLEQTHTVIQLMRDVLDAAAPDVLLITETNVPHVENISYFGDGTDEAQMVYQFSLPPLLLHTFRTGDTTALTTWAQGLSRAGDRTTFFNFTASHDGIGVTPALGILSTDEIAALLELTERHGGYVSYKQNSDGSRSPYEMNITYFDAITDPAVTEENPMLACRRFFCSQAIMLALAGVPGIYFSSLYGSRNDQAGVKATGRYRSINRQKFNLTTLLEEIADPLSIRHQVYTAYSQLLRVRAEEPAFHPFGDQTVLAVHESVFALVRLAPDQSSEVIALHNTGEQDVPVQIEIQNATVWQDLLSGERYLSMEGRLNLRLAAFQVAWLKRVSG